MSSTTTTTDVSLADAPHSGLPGGAKVGRYQVLELVGEGGMGAVYAAYDPELDRRVALKLLHKTFDEDGTSQGRARLLREAQAMARLTHPNVITVHDVGTFDGSVFVAMEFVAGQTLRGWMSEASRELEAVVDVFVRAGNGLVAAHEAGLVHRDFKPENVMVADDGRVRVLDFGLARPGREGAPEVGPSVTAPQQSVGLLEEALTAEGQVMGTPAYMAPEQHLGESVDERCDQFSFCVALYEAAYGERPFSGDTFAALTLAVVGGQIRPVRAEASVPDALRTVLLRGLSVHREDRYASVRELLVAVREAVSDPKPDRTRWIVGSIVAVVAVLTVATAIRFENRGAAPDPCAVEGNELAGTWDDEHRKALLEAFGASDVPRASQTGEHVAETLDTFAKTWTEGRYQACKATRIVRTQSDELMDIRMRCLERARGQLSAFVGQLSEADAATVERGKDVVGALGSPAVCADVDALRRTLPPPEDDATKEAVETLRLELDTLSAMTAAGRYPEAATRAEVVVQNARAVAYRPVLAEALVSWAELQARRGDNDGSVATYLESFYLARELGDENTELAAALDLSFVHGQLMAELDDGVHWARHARALARRLEKPNFIANAYRYEGIANGVKAKYVEAAELYGQALAVLDDEGDDAAEGTESLRVYLDQDLFRIQQRLGDDDAARATSHRALAGMVRLLGREHPNAVMLAAEVAYLDVDAGNVEGALKSSRESVRVLTEVHGENHGRTLHAQRQLAEVLIRAGQPAEAETILRSTTAALLEEFGPEYRALGLGYSLLGDLLYDDGRYDEAALFFDKAIAFYEKEKGPADENAMASRLRAIRTLLKADRAQEALTRAQAGFALLDDKVDPLARSVSEFYVVVAEFAVGDSEPARLARAQEIHAAWSEASPKDWETLEMARWLGAQGVEVVRPASPEPTVSP